MKLSFRLPVLAAVSAILLTVVLAEDAEIAAALMTNRSLLWNTYRPQLYHGVRPRLPHSLMTGLMWFTLNTFSGNQEIRHTAEMSDGLTSFSYTEHDGRYYAAQELVDGKNNVRMEVGWWKDEEGEEWAVRVEGDAIDQQKPSRTSLIYHFGLEGLGGLELENETDQDGIDGTIVLRGTTPQLGDFRIRIVEHADVPHVRPMLRGQDFQHLQGKTFFLGAELPPGQVWQIKNVLINSVNSVASGLMSSGKYTNEDPPDPFALFRLANEVQPRSNVYAFQKAFSGSGVTQGSKWGFDVFYEVADGEGKFTDMSHDQLTNALLSSSKSFTDRFDQTFRLPAPYNTAEHRSFAKAITSNLLGGIGYYHGSSIVDRSFRHDYDDDEPADEDDEEVEGGQRPQESAERELLTATPCRSFFPRGFYWDEGFHLALIGQWDNDLSLQILKDWIGLIDEDGWVAREQILGAESRSRVPAEFVTQYPTYANPPTPVLAITAFIKRLQSRTETKLLDDQIGLDVPLSALLSGSSPQSTLPSLHLTNPHLAHSFLTDIYTPLRRHYLWFRRTQRGLLKPYGRTPTSRVEAYRWRGRTADHVLTSGLDDYPRARPPHSGELHVDLMAWMGFFAKTMQEISAFLGKEADRKEYEKHEKGILANLEDLHWSEEEQMYCDVSVNDDEESYHVCHKGYISLFPFILGLLPPSHPHLAPILDLLTDPKHLWSPYGIRSLSLSHPLFGKDENYWRGPIWMPMNWLALKALKEKYIPGSQSGEERERVEKVYKDLRANLVENMFKEWKRTGYVWEQYNAETGEGQRSHPFTGWGSLATQIMTEQYT